MIPISNYLVENNRAGAMKLVMDNGFDHPVDDQQAVNAINHLITKQREHFMMQLADFHPDYKLIESRIMEKQQADKKPEPEPVSNLTGDEKMSNATASELRAMFEREKQRAEETTNNATGPVRAKPINTTEIVILGGSFLIAAIIIWKAF